MKSKSQLSDEDLEVLSSARKGIPKYYLGVSGKYFGVTVLATTALCALWFGLLDPLFLWIDPLFGEFAMLALPITWLLVHFFPAAAVVLGLSRIVLAPVYGFQLSRKIEMDLAQEAIVEVNGEVGTGKIVRRISFSAYDSLKQIEIAPICEKRFRNQLEELTCGVRFCCRFAPKSRILLSIEKL